MHFLQPGRRAGSLCRGPFCAGMQASLEAMERCMTEHKVFMKTLIGLRQALGQEMERT